MTVDIDFDPFLGLWRTFDMVRAQIRALLRAASQHLALSDRLGFPAGLGEIAQCERCLVALREAGVAEVEDTLILVRAMRLIARELEADRLAS